MLVANLQVKNLPDDVHAKLRERARARHLTVSGFVTQLIEDELSELTTDEWLAEVRQLPRHPDVNVRKALDEARDEIEGR